MRNTDELVLRTLPVVGCDRPRSQAQHCGSKLAPVLISPVGSDRTRRSRRIVPVTTEGVNHLGGKLVDRWLVAHAVVLLHRPCENALV